MTQYSGNNLSVIAHRIAGALTVPPKMLEAALEAAESLVVWHYGHLMREGETVPKQLRMEIERYGGLFRQYVTVPFDLTGWSHLSNLKIDMSADLIERLVSSSIRTTDFKKLILSEFPQLTENDYHTLSTWRFRFETINGLFVCRKYLSHDLGQFTPASCTIDIDIDNCAKQMSDLSIDSVTKRVRSTIRHEMVHFTQHLLSVLIKFDTALKKLLKTHMDIDRDYDMHRSGIGKSYSTNRFAQPFNWKELLTVSISDSFARSCEHILRDVEHKPRVLDAFNYYRDSQFQSFLPTLCLLSPDDLKKAFTGLILEDAHIYGPIKILRFLKENAANETFRRFVTRKLSRVVQDVRKLLEPWVAEEMEGFLRSAVFYLERLPAAYVKNSTSKDLTIARQEARSFVIESMKNKIKRTHSLYPNIPSLANALDQVEPVVDSLLEEQD